jgi:DNA-3-methyladenine glycosylase
MKMDQNIMIPLTIEFYDRPTEVVAKDLLGKYLIRESRLTPNDVNNDMDNDNKNRFIVCRIVEVEAYLGEGDPASHACNGPTPRSSIMFGKPGIAYVYLNYGVHNLLNIVTDAKGKAGAVLLRAIEPVAGWEIIKTNRTAKNDFDLTNGPGKLTKALDVTLNENGLDMTEEINGLFVIDEKTRAGMTTGSGFEEFEIETSPRIGIRNGTDRQLRFTIKGNAYVSR